MGNDYSRFVNPSITKHDFLCFFFTNRYLSLMDSFSEDFKTWMDMNQFTAETLAPVIGKSAGTIANWRSIGVPERSSVRTFLADFMAFYKPSSPSSASDTSTLRIEFNDEELDIVSTAAGIVDTPIRDFIRRAAVHQARTQLEKENAQGNASNGTNG